MAQGDNGPPLVKSPGKQPWAADADLAAAGAKPASLKQLSRGMVGMASQDATCYMISMLQMMFFTGRLRKGVYLMRTISSEYSREDQWADGHSLGRNVQNNRALALQRVFYDLQVRRSRPHMCA